MDQFRWGGSCIDDHSRIAYTAIVPDETTASAITILEAALANYASLGVTVERLMTDNRGC